METKKFIDERGDLERALFIGLLIGVFLVPTEINLGLALPVVVASVCAFPLVALIGLWLARLLVYRVKSLRELARFTLVGVSNTAINFGVLNVLIVATGVERGLAFAGLQAVAFAAALFNSYLWNSHWSFENAEARTEREFAIFFLVTVVGLLLNSLVGYVVTTYAAPLAGVDPTKWANIANLAGSLVAAVWDFLGFKFIVFG
jgi:putative flippase GtrA